jgi:hypothetical protein
LPKGFEGITGPLDDVFDKIGFHDLAVTVLQPDVDPSTDPDPEPLDDEEGGLDFESTEEAPDPEPPVAPSNEQPGPAANAKRVLTIGLEALTDIEIGLPGIDGVKVVINPAPFQVTAVLDPSEAVVSATLGVAVRFDRSLLVPMRLVGDRFEVDETAANVDIAVAEATVRVTSAGSVELEADAGLQLTRPAMIGDTGVIIESASVAFNFSGSGERPEEAPLGWKGVLLKQAKVHVPSIFSGDISVEKLGFGSGGVTGKIFVEFDPPLETTVLGMTGALSLVSIRLRENVPVEGRIAATVKLPFFDFPQPVALDVTISSGGTVSATISGDLTLSRPNLAEFTITSISVGVTQGTGFTSFSGSLRPLVAGIDWPTFEVKDLRVNSNGDVSVGGGWIDLPSQKTLKLYTFLMEITKIGFGTEDDGRRWIGLSGGVKIVDGLKAGASVEGLRIHWKTGTDVAVSLNGVGVELEIPNALSITGAVSLDGEEFRGAVKVVVIPASLTIEGQFVTGQKDGTRFFAIVLRGELPAGIPLGATGLAFYGFQGLYAQHMAPKKADADDWYENADGSPGWYLKAPSGVAQLDKWDGDPGHFAFGAGITLGTFADNGYQFSGRLLLVLTFPGPTILIDGRANLFTKRTELEGADPMFRAFAVIEPEKSFLLNMSAHYKYKKDGQLMNIRGGAEAFFNFQDGDDWHIFIGQKDPPGRRIACKVFNIFDVSGYFQLTPRQLDVGASWGYDKSWGFSRLNVHLKSMFAMDATVSWHPGHFTGSASFSGTAEARAFGRGVGVSVNTTISGDVFEPFHLEGKFWAGINLPWPLPDLGASITLKWEEDLTTPPVLPLPLREVAVEHNKRMLKWPIPRDVALFPNNDAPGSDVGGDLEFRATDTPAVADGPQQIREGAPLVPADSRLGLNFSRPVRDPGLIGVNPTEVVPELIGDPPAGKAAYTVGYTLAAVVLEKHIPAPLAISDPSPRWVAIARAQGAFTDDGVFQIAGSWTPVPPTTSSPQSNSEQLKLLINAKTPFEYTSQTRQVWDAWFENASQGGDQSYPCQPPDPNPDQRFCASFMDVATLPDPNEHQFEDPDFGVTWANSARLTESDATVQGDEGPIDRGLDLFHGRMVGEQQGDIVVTPPPGTDEVRIQVGTAQQLNTPFGISGFLVGKSLVTLNTAAVVTSYSLVNQNDPLADTFPGPGAGKVAVDIDFLPDGRIATSDLTEITLGGLMVPALVFEIELEIVPVIGLEEGEPQEAPPTRVEVIMFTADEQRIVQEFVFAQEPTPLRLRWPAGIVRVTIRNFGQIQAVLHRLYLRTPVTATALSRSTPADSFGPFVEQNGVVTVRGENLGPIRLGTVGGGTLMLLEFCTPNRRVELTRRTFTSLEQLTRGDQLFDPQANYRLVVVTRRTDETAGDGGNNDDARVVDNETRFIEQAYFHVVGPPGIEVPDPPADTEPGPTGFEDLRFYVKTTVPAIKFDDDDKPIVPRAFYRAYDVAFGFNEPSAVEKMYRLARRDLTLRVFDAAGNPVVDAEGRVVIPGVRWERASSPTLTEATSRWVRLVNAAQCRPADIPVFDESDILGDQTVTGPAEVVLPPEALHQARLVPALLHESFINPIPGLVADGTHQLERWVLDENNGATPSRWEIGSEPLFDPNGQPILDLDGKPARQFFLTEKTGIRSAVIYRGPIAAPNDDSHPTQWTDFRASVQCRWSAGSVSFQFRRANTGNKLWVSLSRDSGALFVTAGIDGTQHSLHAHTVDFGSPLSDFVLTVECVGNKLRVSHAGAAPVDLVLPANSSPMGTIGLRTDAPAGCRFTEVRVDDLRPDPAAAHRIDFITSKYSNFAHHLGSFDERVLEPATGLGIIANDLSQQVVDHSVAVPGPGSVGSDPIDDLERRDFDDLEKKIIGESGVLRSPERVEIIRASHDPDVFAFLVRSPEPLLWERTVLTPSFSAPENPMEIGVPGVAKIARVTFGATPADEIVTLLVREGTNLGGYTLQWRPLPDAATPDPAWAEYYQFGAEGPLEDGTAVLVLAGSAAEAPAREPGTTHRFLAAKAGEGTLHFVAPGVELRLRDSAGRLVHQRQFRTPDVFTGLELRAVRKLDGTGLVLFLPTDVTPPPLSVLRLTFVLTRNAGASLPVLRQAGSESPEVVVLDLMVGG